MSFKVKIIEERPNRKFGDREATYFITLPNSAKLCIHEIMLKEGVSQEEAIKRMILRGMKIMDSNFDEKRYETN